MGPVAQEIFEHADRLKRVRCARGNGRTVLQDDGTVTRLRRSTCTVCGQDVWAKNLRTYCDACHDAHARKGCTRASREPWNGWHTPGERGVSADDRLKDLLEGGCDVVAGGSRTLRAVRVRG